MSNPFETDPFHMWKQQQAVPTGPTPEESTPPVCSEGISIAYADITVVLDKSGSMGSMQRAVIDGFNSYVNKMRETPGDSRWTMVTFDDYSSARGAGEAFPRTVYEHKGEKEVPLLSKENFQPRGGTALIDAVCKTIQTVELRTSGREDLVKPIMVIITDGQENSSIEYRKSDLREMVARTQAKNWNYIYLGANQDAFAEAGGYGMNQNLSWLSNTVGGCLVASGGLDLSQARNTGNFQATAAGIGEAIFSGLVGCANMVSGSVYQGNLYNRQGSSASQVQ